METPSGIREARPNERRALGHSLALAFEDDPVSVYLYPDPETRLSRLRKSYSVIIPALTRNGALYCDTQLYCGAVWQAPSAPALPRLAQLAFNLRMWLNMGSAIGRGQILADAMQASHIREPHWYLGVLGTRPDQQGKGLGSRVLSPVLSRCDHQGSTAYLESSKESNVPFYQRHGFEVTGEIRVPDGPTLWAMRREPR